MPDSFYTLSAQILCLDRRIKLQSTNRAPFEGTGHCLHSLTEVANFSQRCVSAMHLGNSTPLMEKYAPCASTTSRLVRHLADKLQQSPQIMEMAYPLPPANGALYRFSLHAPLVNCLGCAQRGTRVVQRWKKASGATDCVDCRLLSLDWPSTSHLHHYDMRRYDVSSIMAAGFLLRRVLPYHPSNNSLIQPHTFRSLKYIGNTFLASPNSTFASAFDLRVAPAGETSESRHCLCETNRLQ